MEFPVITELNLILYISRSDFQNGLVDQIQIGVELQNKIRLGVNINPEFILDSYELWDEYNREYLNHVFDTTQNALSSGFANISVDKRPALLSSLRYYVSNDIYLAIQKKIKFLKKILDKTEFFSVMKRANTRSQPPLIKIENMPTKTKAFIVHGHDPSAKVEVARLIEKLGIEAIILHEQSNHGKTIIESIEHFTDVGFAIVLYTACDLGTSRDRASELKNRARQNVVFEHGYLMAKIGRANVLALVKGDIETPSDISGILYTTMDEHGAWKSSVAKAMKNAGYSIDMNTLI